MGLYIADARPDHRATEWMIKCPTLLIMKQSLWGWGEPHGMPGHIAGPGNLPKCTWTCSLRNELGSKWVLSMTQSQSAVW